MTDGILSFRETEQPSVAVYALDTVIRRQDALDKAAERERELQRLAEAEAKREDRVTEALETLSGAGDPEKSKTPTQNPVETYASDGNQSSAAGGLGLQVSVLA